MFKFLSLFRRNRDEQLNDNEYDFNENPVSVTSVTDVDGAVEAHKPALTDNSIGTPRKDPTPPSPPLDTTLADQARITDIRGELRDITDGSHREDQADPDSQEEETPFDITDKTLLGRGGENFVYDIPDDPSIVGRVAIEPLIAQLAETEGLPGTTAREKLQATLAAENATYDELCTYFGNEQVPQMTSYVRRIPTSRKFLEEVHEAKGRAMQDGAPTPTDMLTIVAIQEKVPEINNDNSLDVQSGFAERRNPAYTLPDNFEQDYEDATQSLICNPESATFDLDQFLIIHPQLAPIVKQAETIPQLKDSLKDFVQKAIRYSKETGKALDLFGPKNILFFENSENSWNYKLVDAIPPPNQQKSLERVEGLMEKVTTNEPLDDDEKFFLTCAVNYARSLNGLAKYLGVEDRITIMLPGQTIDPSKLWNVLLDWGPPQKSSGHEYEDEETPLQQAA